MSDLVVELDRLIGALTDARKVFDESVDGGRAGSRMALLGIYDFLLDIGVTQNLTGPVFALATALQDLENGKQNPMMVKSDVAKTKPPETITDGQIKAVAAAGMDLLMQNKKDKDEAARIIFRAMDNWNHSLNSKSFTYKTIQSWRDRIRSGNRNSDNDAATYYTVLDTVRKHSDGPPAEVKFILREAINSILKDGLPWASPAPKEIE
jgi:hypothetical protein